MKKFFIYLFAATLCLGGISMIGLDQYGSYLERNPPPKTTRILEAKKVFEDPLRYGN